MTMAPAPKPRGPGISVLEERDNLRHAATSSIVAHPAETIQLCAKLQNDRHPSERAGAKCGLGKR